MAYSNGGSIEIDITLGMDGIDRDFDELAKKAKEGTRSVVKAVSQITAAMEETGAGAKEAGQDYEKATSGMEQSAKEAARETDNLQETMEKTTDSTDDLKESEDQLGRQSKKTGEEQEDLGDKTEETRKEVEKSRESFISWGEVAQTAIKGVVVVAGTLFAAMGTGVGAATNFGTEYKQASNSIQASTGATKEEMEGLRDVMKNVYANNFGEDMNDVADAVANVKKNIGGTDQEIQKATESAFAFRDTFGYDIPESTRAAKAMMQNFNVTAEEAYDLMAKGAQNGLDYSGELLDNISEYSVQFGKAGLSAEDMFNIMQAGADSGAWNLDKIGDAVKELNIRLVDGSDTTKEGLKAIGMNADEVAKKMSNGGETARKTYRKVVKSLAEMDDKQAQNIAGVNLFGTMWEDLGPEVIAQLADVDGAYNDVKGTMDEINEVKYDDAKSALEALKRKAETSLLLPISEDIMPAVSEATKAATGYIEQLADAYDNNNVQGLVEKSGEIFADIATNAAEQAPKMVNVAVGFVEQAVEGFKKNEDKLVEAGANMVKAIAGAAVKALPRELREPVEDAVDDLVDSLTGGGIKNGLKTFGTMFENGFKAVTKVTKTVLPPFIKLVDKTADNMDVLIPLVAAGATAFKGYKIVDGVTSSLKASAKAIELLAAAEKNNTVAQLTATTAIKAKDIVVGALTGKIKLATAATTAWNGVLTAFGGPVGLITTGVVALTAAYVAYRLATDDSVSADEKLTEAHNKLKDSLTAVSDSASNYISGISTAGSIFDDFNDSIIVSNERQQELASKMESVQSEITQIAKTATEERRSLTESEIQRLDELFDQMRELTAAELEIQEAYADAVKSSAESLAKSYEGTAEDYAEASQKIINSAEETRQNVIDKAYSQMIETNAINKQLVGTSDEYTQEWYDNEAAAAQERYQLAVESAQSECNDTLQVILDGYMQRMTAGTEYFNGLKEANAAEEKENQRYNEELKRLTDERNHAYAISGGEHTDQTRTLTNELEALEEQHKENLAAIWDAKIQKLSESGDEEAGILLAMVAQTASSGKELNSEAKTMVENYLSAFDSLPDEMKQNALNTIEPMLQELAAANPELEKYAGENAQTILDKLKEVLEIHSPSQAVKRIFSYVNPGAMEGLDEGKDGLLEKGTSLINDLLNVISGGNVESAGKQAGQNVVKAVNEGLQSVDAKPTGTSFGTQYSSGISSTIGKNNTAAKGVATAARTSMAAIKAIATGAGFGTQYASGVSSKSGTSRLAGSTVAIAARSAMASVSAAVTGSKMGSEYSSGIQGKSGSARSAGSQIANSARSGVASVGSTDLGQNFGQGFINGIGSMVGGAVRAAANFASSALSAVQKTINSHSPSKETDKLGQNFGQGFIGAVVRLTAKAAEAAGEMGKQSVNEFRRNLQSDGLEFDVETVMKRADDVVQGRVASYSAMQDSYSLQKSVSSDEFKKKADYLIDGFKKVVREQGDAVIYWRDREIARMFREVCET